MVFLDSQIVRYLMDSREPIQFPDAASVAKLSAWVMFAVQIFQALTGNVSIDLGRREVAVAQQELYDA